jgi:hypothetical protein
VYHHLNLNYIQQLVVKITEFFISIQFSINLIIDLFGTKFISIPHGSWH